MEQQCCKNCLFWMQSPPDPNQPPEQAFTGWCRRYPPRVLWIDSPNMPGAQMKPDVHSFMPAVHGDIWCGEYKPKPKGKNKGKAKTKTS